RGAGAARRETPAVIAAFDLGSIEPAIAQRDAAMRANVAQGEDRPVAGAAQEQRLAEQRLGQSLAAPQPLAGDGEVPHLPKRRAAVILQSGIPSTRGQRRTRARE